MEGEDACFWLFLFIWKDISLWPTYPRVGSKSCSSPQKFIWWVGLLLKIFRKRFLEGDERPQGIEE